MNDALIVGLLVLVLLIVAAEGVILVVVMRSGLAEIRADVERPTELPAPESGWIQGVLRKRITVHTKGGQSLEGSLADTMDDGLVLRAAQLLNDEGAPTPMAGEVFVPRDHVAFAQLDE